MQPLAKEIFELLEAIHKHHFVSILKPHLHTNYRLLAINAWWYEEITSLGEKETLDREELYQKANCKELKQDLGCKKSISFQQKKLVVFEQYQ